MHVGRGQMAGWLAGGLLARPVPGAHLLRGKRHLRAQRPGQVAVERGAPGGRPRPGVTAAVLGGTWLMCACGLASPPQLGRTGRGRRRGL